jgi:hypothetical protein
MNDQIPEGADECIRQDVGYPPKLEDWHFSLEKGDEGQYQFSMFEGAELYLGTKLFSALPTLFSKINGVDRVKQVDRESYLIGSGLNENDLLEELWKVFLIASEASFKRTNVVSPKYDIPSIATDFGDDSSKSNHFLRRLALIILVSSTLVVWWFLEIYVKA